MGLILQYKAIEGGAKILCPSRCIREALRDKSIGLPQKEAPIEEVTYSYRWCRRGFTFFVTVGGFWENAKK
jgi:hypothetical protein